MACSSSTLNSSSFVPPASLVVSDQELPDDGSSVVSSCILCKFFGFYEVSRVCLQAQRQYPAGVFLPVAAPSLRQVIDNFSFFTREHYSIIACAHVVRVLAAYRKDYIRDMLHVHVCDADCISNLVVFKLLKAPRHDFSNQIVPEPFRDSFRKFDANAHCIARAGISDVQRSQILE
ncbi:hypothetical protein F4604DRAFT_1937712 [Suillus subluteus]|nr:hypothetical protein F4604DRAFT_1937712 [Suillus subluteus]